MYGNCTESLQEMLRADSEYELKSRAFDHERLFEKVKPIVSGLDTKVSTCIPTCCDVHLYFVETATAHTE